MNKLFSKIVGASLAIAMMIGVGVGVNVNKQAKEVNADASYSLTPNNANTELTNETYITTLTEFTYSGISWKMNQWNPKTLQIKTNQSNAASEFRFYNTSAFSGKITRVVITFSAFGVSDASKLMFRGGSSEVSETSGGTAGTWNSSAKTLTWSPASSTNYTFFAFYQNGKAASGTNYLANSNSIVVDYATNDNEKTIQADSLTIKSGSNIISGIYKPNSPYFGDTLDLTDSVVNYHEGDDYQDGQGAINWSSSDTDVATISDGIVTFVSAGTTTITATAVDKGAADATVSASFTLDLTDAIAAPGTSGNPYTAVQALAAEPKNGVYVKGIVSTITEVSPSHGNATYKISDDGTQTNEIIIYRGKYTNNVAFTATHQIQLGDRVVITGNLSDYNDVNQLAQNNYITSLIPVKHTVTYNANGADSGTAPVDTNEYQRNISNGITTVTTKANSGNLQKAGYSFNGWNTKADPTADGAVHYNANAEIQITDDLILYAEWLSLAPSITVQANLSGYTGQSVDLDFSYGNITNESNISVVAADNKVTVGDLIAENGVGAVTITFNTAGETSLSFRNSGEELATCAVIVNQSEISITGLPSKGKVQIGSTLNLGSQTAINHSGIYSDDVVWESSDTNVATVNDSGVVTGKAIGQTTITVTSIDKLDVYQSCVVNVYKGALFNSLNLKAKTYVATGDHLVTWNCDYATLTNTSDPEAGAGGTKATNYLGGDANNRTSSRMYGGNIMTITPKIGYAISSVEFVATQANYATALSNSTWTNATATANNTITTITPANGTTAISAVIGGTCGFETVKIYISPKAYLQSASTIKTISGVESDGGATVENVALRFGGVIPVSVWNTINSNWEITDYGVMFARESMLTARSKTSLEEVFRNNPADVAIVHKQTFTAPVANGDDYVFTARLNLEESDYDTVFYAAPYIVAGGEYYFLPEMHYSVRTLAEECYNNGGSSLSQTALATLKGNN